MRYLYIFEDGHVGQSDSGPTSTDIVLAEDGGLHVLSIDPASGLISEYVEGGRWTPVREAVIRTEDEEVFHFPSGEAAE